VIDVFTKETTEAEVEADLVAGFGHQSRPASVRAQAIRKRTWRQPWTFQPSRSFAIIE
jgi:hypothetical protein